MHFIEIYYVEPPSFVLKEENIYQCIQVTSKVYSHAKPDVEEQKCASSHTFERGYAHTHLSSSIASVMHS